MDAKTIVGIVLVLCVVAAIVIVKIRSSKK